MGKKSICFLTVLGLWSGLFLGGQIAAHATADGDFAVFIDPVVNNRTTVEIRASNPNEKQRMGTIAVTIKGSVIVPENPSLYDVLPPGGPVRLATFTPQGDGWKMRPRDEKIVASELHVELYRDHWKSGAEERLRLPITITGPGPVELLIRVTFSKRVDGLSFVDTNFPASGITDEQGLPCEDFEIPVMGSGGGGVPKATIEKPTTLARSERSKQSSADSESEYQEKAKAIVFSKSKKNVHYKVFQSMEDGSLCTEGTWNDFLEEYMFDGEDFYWADTTNTYTADGEKFRGDLYWCGTYHYTTVKDVSRTLNAYTTDLDMAIILVRLVFDLYDEDDLDGINFSDDDDDEDDDDINVLGSGTGFFITDDGYILTNYHVASGEGVPVVVAEDHEPRVAKIVATDEETDLALLKVDGTAVPVTFGSGETAQLAQTVFTIGYPSPDIQGIAPKVTMGIISSLTGIMDDEKSYQIDAAVQPGNSGGPLFSSTGEVMGVVYARIDDAIYTMATGSIAQKINYAIKNSHVMAFLKNRPDVYDRIKRGRVGARTQEEAVSKISKSVVLIIVFGEED
ncbi:MAG: trypsin-like serine protease [Candidatus Hydrogenedentes bacterium]|jgi:S1-C subfamily serine protease|nr:trypsin-like serine protease [Candidatus Hydrogenedentota bacterium]